MESFEALKIPGDSNEPSKISGLIYDQIRIYNILLIMEELINDTVWAREASLRKKKQRSEEEEDLIKDLTRRRVMAEDRISADITRLNELNTLAAKHCDENLLDLIKSAAAMAPHDKSVDPALTNSDVAAKN